MRLDGEMAFVGCASLVLLSHSYFKGENNNFEFVLALQVNSSAVEGF